MHGNTRKDFEANFPLILRHFEKEKLADSFDSEILPHPTPMRWRKSRNAVKRSSKKSSASRHIHELESQTFFEKFFPDKKKALILRFHEILRGKETGYFADTTIGEFRVIELAPKLWVASWRYKRAIGRSPGHALARLMGMKWAEYTLAQSRSYYATMYDFYREIFFEFPFSKKKKPRDNTLKIREIKHFRMAWEGIAVKPLHIPTPKPEPELNHKPRMNFGNFGSEKSLI